MTNTLPVHPLEQQYTISSSSAIEFSSNSSNNNMNNNTPSSTPKQSSIGHQQRAYSVTSMPSELQKRHEQEQALQQQQEKSRLNQPWWQYYYQLYHYHLPPGRKPTVFGPYLLLQTLGEGEFGKVKFGIEVKTGQEVAIKLIRKDSIDSSSRMTKVEREISVLRILHHPNIVKLFDVIETEKYIGIILQCATGGELFDYILAHRYLKERDASRLFAQLISGVHYMHQKHIVHRDLKLENLLLDRHRNVLITDFGFANQFSSPQDDLMSTSCGSPCYAAPELVMNQGVYVGPAVDIWSCGVILFAMLCGYLPYDDDPANPESYNINLLYKYILNTPLIFPDYISDEACDLLSLMLVPDPEKRCSMDQIMNHPWLAPHKHLFVQVEKEEEEDLVMDEEEEPTSEPTRRNTIANIIINDKEEEQVVPEKIVEEEAIVEAAEATEAIVPEVEAVEEVENDQIMQDKPVAVNKEEEDTIMQEITSTELPPLTLIEDDETSAKKDDTLMTEPQTPVIVENTITTTKEGELHTVSPLPTTTKSTSKIRPRSTVSSSTEKVLHFLSGHSNTPKPTTTRNTSNEKKRTRHMSLANPSTATNKMDLASPPSPTTTTSTSSILHSKFLSSIRTTNKSPATTEVKAAPSPVAISASTPHPSQKNKRPVRPSTTVAPSPQPSPSPQPQQQQQRGARRKTLSLLVNSMTDNKPFNRRRSTLRSPLPPSTPTTVVEAPEEEKAEDKKQARMMPSVSEHTINTLSTAETNKEKHRSAGKKLMDWFKKKPLSTIHRSTNDNMLHHHEDNHAAVVENDIRLRIHHGAVDQEALTSRPPAQVFEEVKQTLKSLGLEFKRDGGEYKLKCARPKKPIGLAKPTATALQHQNPIQQQNGGTGTPFRMLLRRSSAATAAAGTSTDTTPTIYGDPNVDPGEEVRFSVELCKIKNLPGLYIVDMRRMRGNVWAYKFIYRTLLDTLNLGGKSGYLQTAPKEATATPETTESGITTTTTTDEDHSHHRMSTASSGGTSVLQEEAGTAPPPMPLAKEIAV